MASKSTASRRPPRKSAPASTAPQPSAPPASSRPRPGQLVTVKSDDANAPASYALVVDTVDKTEHRDAGVYIVPLPAPVHLPADQVESA